MVAHLAIPKIYLQHAGFVRVPFNAYSNWPLNVELLYALAMAVQDYALAKLVNLAFLTLLTVAVYRFASRAAAPWAGIAAASLLLANDVVQVEGATAHVDIAVAFFFFMAATLAVEFRESGDRRSLVMCGVACGCMAGSKITGLAALACVVPLVVAAPPRGGRYRQRAGDLALLTIPALALAAPWLIKNYVYTGDPLYPALWKYFHGIDWNATVDAQFWRWQQSIGMGRTARDYVLLPVRVILFASGDYRHFAAWISKTWIVFVPVALVASPFVAVVRRCLIPAGLYFVVWALTSQQTRFLIAILPLLAVSAAVAMAWLVTLVGWVSTERIGLDAGRWRLTQSLAVLVVAGCLVHLARTSRYIVRPAPDLFRTFLNNPPDLRTWVPDRSYAFIRDRLPASARIMMLNTNHGFFVDREYIADSFFEASQLNALIRDADGRPGLTKLFARLGVSHVLVKHEDWVPFPQTLWDYLGDPANARVIYSAGDMTLYELRPGQASQAGQAQMRAGQVGRFDRATYRRNRPS
jgi:hypothetical protein